MMPTPPSGGQAVPQPRSKHLRMQVRDLSKFYGKTIGCLNISFDVTPGRIIGIAGRSGAGKTALLSCISGRISPTNGAVQVVDDNGPEPADGNSGAMPIPPHWMSLACQNPRDLLNPDLSAGANLGERLMGLGIESFDIIRKKAALWLERVGIDSARMDEPPSAFSEGMQKRLVLAAVLASHPPVLLLDTPFSGLDPEALTPLPGLIQGQVTRHRLMAVLTLDHIGKAAEICEQIHVMDTGRIVESGSPRQLMTDPEHPATRALVAPPRTIG